MGKHSITGEKRKVGPPTVVEVLMGGGHLSEAEQGTTVARIRAAIFLISVFIIQTVMNGSGRSMKVAAG